MPFDCHLKNMLQLGDRKRVLPMLKDIGNKKNQERKEGNKNDTCT